MMKKLISIMLSLLMLLSSLPVMTAQAASYTEQLVNEGFPRDYAEKLAALHSTYPKWNFVPVATGLNFKDAVAGERSTHKSQIIEKSYPNDYFCACSKCKKNGNYVTAYSGCYAASEWAVSYFMDPRNWLDEKHIFQFEDNHYSSSHNAAGVEKIIASTWMKNSYITYTDTSGNTVKYTDGYGNNKKYSKAILEAAKASNMSAYYIASRIVKEVGTTKPANVSGVAGNKLPFMGIYNFYSIGATSGGMSGLEWAAGWLRAEKATTLYASYDYAKNKGTGATTKVSQNQYMTFIAPAGKYYLVRLYTTGNGYSTNGAVGFVSVSALRTAYFTYGRPWTDPYKSIVGGAQYIADGYLKTQYTGYYEKFNVNPASSRLYSHEYMQNVDAPSKEALSKYNAYANAGQLSAKKTFYIPVFKNMDAAGAATQEETTDTTQVQHLAVTAVSPTKIKIAWTAVSGTGKYKIRIKNLTKGTVFYKTVKTNAATLNNFTNGNLYQIDVKAKVQSGWGRYSEAIQQRCLPKKVTLSSLTTKKKQLTAVWKKTGGAAGYQVYISTDKKFKSGVIKKTVNAKTLKSVVKRLKSGKTYYVKVRAYTTLSGKKYYGKFSSKKKIKVK